MPNQKSLLLPRFRSNSSSYSRDHELSSYKTPRTLSSDEIRIGNFSQLGIKHDDDAQENSIVSQEGSARRRDGSDRRKHFTKVLQRPLFHQKSPHKRCSCSASHDSGVQVAWRDGPKRSSLDQRKPYCSVQVSPVKLMTSCDRSSLCELPLRSGQQHSSAWSYPLFPPSVPLSDISLRSTSPDKARLPHHNPLSISLSSRAECLRQGRRGRRNTVGSMRRDAPGEHIPTPEGVLRRPLILSRSSRKRGDTVHAVPSFTYSDPKAAMSVEEVYPAHFTRGTSREGTTGRDQCPQGLNSYPNHTGVHHTSHFRDDLPRASVLSPVTSGAASLHSMQDSFCSSIQTQERRLGVSSCSFDTSAMFEEDSFTFKSLHRVVQRETWRPRFRFARVLSLSRRSFFRSPHDKDEVWGNGGNRTKRNPSPEVFEETPLTRAEGKRCCAKLLNQYGRFLNNCDHKSTVVEDDDTCHEDDSILSAGGGYIQFHTEPPRQDPNCAPLSTQNMCVPMLPRFTRIYPSEDLERLRSGAETARKQEVSKMVRGNHSGSIDALRAGDNSRGFLRLSCFISDEQCMSTLHAARA